MQSKKQKVTLLSCAVLSILILGGALFFMPNNGEGGENKDSAIDTEKTDDVQGVKGPTHDEDSKLTQKLISSKDKLKGGFTAQNMPKDLPEISPITDKDFIDMGASDKCIDYIVDMQQDKDGVMKTIKTDRECKGTLEVLKSENTGWLRSEKLDCPKSFNTHSRFNWVYDIQVIRKCPTCGDEYPFTVRCEIERCVTDVTVE